MNTIQEILVSKISIEHERLIDNLRSNSKAMHSRHAAKGLIRSGATISAEVDNSKNTLYLLRDMCIKHLQVLTGDTTPLSEPAISYLKSKISEMFSKTYDATLETMAKSCELSSKPQLQDRFMPEIKEEMNKTLSEVTLFIDEKVILKNATNKTSSLDPKPPELLQNIKWFLAHGWENKYLIAGALIFLIVVWILSQPGLSSALLEEAKTFILCMSPNEMERPLNCSI